MKQKIIFTTLLLFLFSAQTAQASFSQGYALLQKGQFNQAANVFQQAIQQNPNDAPSLSSLAMCLEKLKRYDEATQAWRRYDRLKPSQGRINQHILLLGKMKQILPALKENPLSASSTISAILKDPYPQSIIRLDCLLTLGHYYYARKQFSQSFSLYAQAVSSYPRYFLDDLPFSEYGHLLKNEKKKFLEAAKVYKEIITRPQLTINRDDLIDSLAESYKLQAEEYEKQKKEKQAKTMYEKILLEAPLSKYADLARSKVGDIVESVGKMRENADAYFEAGEYQKALNLYKLVLANSESKEKSGYARFRIALSLAWMNKFREALKAYHNLVREMPNNQYADDALVNAGCLLAGVLKKPEYAIKEFGIVLQRYPKGDMVDDAIYYAAYTYMRILKDNRKAYKGYLKLIRGYPDSPWVVRAKENIEEMKREKK